jgi:hypothetical protein
MLLVEYLRTHREIASGLETVLAKMVTQSDNDAAAQAGSSSRSVSSFQKPHRRLARRLLAGIVEWQSYGIPAVARTDWKVFFKCGWRTGLRNGRLLHRVARLQRDDTVVSIAVLMDAVPSETFGMETLGGTTKRLLAGSHVHRRVPRGIPSSSHLHDCRLPGVPLRSEARWENGDSLDG